MKREIEEKFNGAIDLGVVCLGGAIVSGILLLTPAKVVGYIGVGGSVGGFIASTVTKKKVVSCGVEIIQQKDSVINYLNEKLNQSNLEYQSLSGKKAKVLELANQALALQDELTQVRSDIASKSEEITSLRSQLEQATANSNASLESIKLTILETIGERQRSLHAALEGFTKRKDYQLSNENVHKFEADIDEVISRQFKALQDASTVESACRTLHKTTDELANVKVRMVRSYQTLITQSLLIQIEELEQVNQKWSQADLVPRIQLTELRKNCEAQLREFHLTAKDQIGEIYGYAQQLEKQLPEDEKFFESLRSQIQEYERKLREASKPHRFVGATEQARVGNSLID